MKSSHIPAFYDPRMSLDQEKWQGYTQTPAKPKLMMEYLERKNLMEYFRIKDDWPPYDREDFYIAHTREMVDNFFDRGKTSRILNMQWSPEYAKSVRYENASLYYAIRHAVLHPDEVCFSPSSAFHHANPTRGALFCAFSGQVKSRCRFQFGCSYYKMDRLLQ